jgi:hypothetical protein
VQHVRLVIVVVALLVLAARPASAVVLGGGPARSDCWSVFDGVAASRNGQVECTDGEACDADERADGVCTFRVRLCANEPDVRGCRPRRLARLRILEGAPLDPPPMRTAARVCGAFAEVPVALRGTRRDRAATTAIRLVARARGRRRPDRDVLRLRCRPNPTPDDAACPARGDGPRELTLTVGQGGDFDLGWNGAAHDLPGVPGAAITWCLSGCNGTTDPTCNATARVGADTPNGALFGTPQPLVADGVPLCLVHRYEGTTLRATADVETGAFDATQAPIALRSEVFRTQPASVCPRCTGTAVGDEGTCDAGPRQGRGCRIDAIVPVGGDAYRLSRDCPPGAPQGTKQATLRLRLPLTTRLAALAGTTPCSGQARDDACEGGTCAGACGPPGELGGIPQHCCTAPPLRACFPTAADAGGRVERGGLPGVPAPPWPEPTWPKTAALRLAAASCASASGQRPVLDALGLAGPVAVELPAEAVWVR